MILNVEKALIAIKKKLISNEKIRKLLYICTPDALEYEAPIVEQLENYISLRPVIEYGENTGINNFILISLNDIEAVSNSIEVNINVSVFCSLDYWQLDNNKLRLYQLGQEIYNTLQNQRVNLLGKLQFNGLEHDVLNSRLDSAGFSMRFYARENLPQI